MNSMNKPSELLKKHGWVQGKYSESDFRGNLTGYCFIGACETAGVSLANWKEPSEIGKKLKAIIMSMYGTESFVVFNDAVGRTKDQVIEVLELVGL